MELKELTKGIVHISTEGFSSLLTRYGELNENILNKYEDVKVLINRNNVSFLDVKIEITTFEEGYQLKLKVSSDDIFYGLGDSSRNSLCLENKKYLLETSNVTCYGPDPTLICLNGWALFVNTTYSSIFDIRTANNEEINIYVKGGKPDFYLFNAKSLKELVKAITDLTGKPTMLPVFGYGLTIVQNEKTDVNLLLKNVKTVREKDIPCDVFGLEPYWMNQYYDLSIDKEWNKELFPLPSWHDKSYCGPQSFFYPLRDNGMNLSLWLCENYDLYYEEERKLGFKKDEIKSSTWAKETQDFDSHLNNPCYTDKITKIDEPFFKHLEKFVDNGAVSFKLDGYTQVLKHPDRYWGMKYHDDEIHNLYPLTIAKQLQEGFKKYTGRRPLIYSSGFYTGEQKYVATWSGDTGGGIKPLTSVLQHALLGHTNASIDMDITSLANIHYGFLLSWTELDVWSYYFYPWNLGEEKENIFKYYSKLRSSLFPYIYMNAYVASKTGLPIVRPLIMEYEDKKYANTFNSFMLGDNMLVSIPAKKEEGKSGEYVDSNSYKIAKTDDIKEFEIDLPSGIWVDYFTNKEYKGKITYTIPRGKGGALFVKKDSIFVSMKPQKYILEKEHEYQINVYGSGETLIYEDDGFTYDYVDNGCSITKISSKVSDNVLTLCVNKPQGTFKGRPNNGADIVNNSIPVIPGKKDIKPVDVILNNYIAKSVLVGSKELDFEIIEGNTIINNIDINQGIEIKVNL